MIRKIVFTGTPAQMYPQGVSVQANTPAEALSALEQFPGFLSEDGQPVFSVRLPDFPSYSALHHPTDKETLIVEEVLEGAGGRGGVLQIVIGAVLVVAAIATGNPFLAQTGLTLTGQVAVAGAMMIAGGVLQMLMPQPQLSVNSNDPRSNYLPANKNTTAVGTPVPLLFGQRRVWPHILSYNVTATNLQNPATATPSPGVGSAAGNSEYEITYDNWSTINVGGA